MSTQTQIAPTEFVEVSNQISGIAEPERWLVDSLGGGTRSSAGVTINYYNAMGLPTVWASVQLIAGHFGELPFEVRRKTGTGSEVIENHPTTRSMDPPSHLQTEQVFRETLMSHALVSGNGRAVILRNGVGQPVEYLLMWPESSYSQMIDGEKWHFTTFDPRYVPFDSVLPRREPLSGSEAQGAGAWYKFHDSDVLHLPGLSYNGLWGFTVYHILRDIFGIEKASLDQAGNAFRNYGRPGLVIEIPRGQLTTRKELNEFRQVWNEAHGGVMNAGKTGFLRHDMKLHQISRDSGDTQFVEQRKVSSEQVAMIFGTQNMLGEGKAVYKDLAQRMAAYVTNTLSKWLRKFENECDRKLLSERERVSGGIYHRFDVGKLLRGDINTLADYTGKLVIQKALSPNDVREMHGLNRVPGLDEYPTQVSEEPDPVLSPMAPREPQDDEAENKARKLHFVKMLKAEARRVTQAARKHDRQGFMSWATEFVPEQREKYYSLCDDLGMPTYMADDYAWKQLINLRRIVDDCEDCPDELTARVEQYYSDKMIQENADAITAAPV